MGYGEKLIGYLDSVAFEEKVRRAALRPQPFVTISRQAGAGGTTLAQAILQEMESSVDPLLRGWNILDRRLCELVAADAGLSVSMDALMKEAFRTDFEDYIMHFVAEDSPQAAVITKVFKCLRAAAAAGKVVVVGRAGACVTRHLPLGVHVRLVAPMRWRLANLMKRENLGTREAQKRLEELELSRRRLVSNYFHADIADPLLYDATFNVEALGPAGIAPLVVDLVRRKAAAFQPLGAEV